MEQIKLEERIEQTRKELEQLHKLAKTLDRLNIDEGVRNMATSGFIFELQEETARAHQLEEDTQKELNALHKEYAIARELVESIQQYCIKNNYYTCGTNAEYSKMFDDIMDGTSTLEDTALDIYFHSDYTKRQIDRLQIFKDISKIRKDITSIYNNKEEE